MNEWMEKNITSSILMMSNESWLEERERERESERVRGKENLQH